MKNLLVYLHGFGSDKSENLEFQKALAAMLNAHLLSPQAEMPSGRSHGGFAWYPISKDRKHHVNNKLYVLQQSLAIIDIITKVKDLDLDFENVILSGHSQGAYTALKIGLSGMIQKPKAIITFNGYYIDGGLFEINESNKNTPILWANSDKDGFLPKKKQDSHNILSKQGINPNVITINNSNHDILSSKDIGPVLTKLKEMGIQY